MKDIRGLAKAERQFHRQQSSQTIRAQLAGDTCSALGIIAKSNFPVLALCRKLVDAGQDPATPLEAYRGDKLALRVKSIGQAAQLRVTADHTGRPIFKREETTARASPIRPNLEAAE